jgi:predicted unusual protein kinase regulating ubiquinone biosynthesis (AarF/ABC1/UbiB family)
MRTKKEFEELGNKDIYVPQIYDQYTSKRTLVMEWIDGTKITNTFLLE